MDRYKTRSDLERAFKVRNKAEINRLCKEGNSDGVADILWEALNDADDGLFTKRELAEKNIELETLLAKIKDLNNKSGQRVRCIKALPNRRALVQLGPIKEEVIVSPNVDMSKLVMGTEVLIIGNGEGRLLSQIRDNDICDGRISKVQRILNNNRVVINDGGYELIMKVADGVFCKEGDEVRYELDSQIVLEIIKNNSSYTLNEIPPITFDDVKGLEEEKLFIKERIIYPIVHKEKFMKYGIKPIRAMLLHGSSGCGKTLLATAIFNEISKLTDKGKGFFVINGPEVLSKWAGTTEETIRKIFEEARNIATNVPSIIFWDEIESVARKRTDSLAYSPEKTIVPTLLTEIQGLDASKNVMFIAATNRPDLLDPALMRPGRLGDAVIEIPKPSKEAAMEILNAKFSNIPKSLKNLNIREKVISHIYENETPIAFAVLKNGEKVPVMRQEQINGALFAQIGEEIVRTACLAEIYNKTINMEILMKLVESILLNQVNVLGAGTKNGFNEDFVVDVSIA